MEDETRRRVEREVSQERPLAARYIAEDFGCTEEEVLDVACAWLARHRGLATAEAELRAATGRVVAARDYRSSTEQPPPGKQYRKGQLQAVRTRIERLHSLLEEVDSVAHRLWDDPLAWYYVDDARDDLSQLIDGDAWDALPELINSARAARRALAIPPKGRGDGGTITLVPEWQLCAAEEAVRVWSRTGQPLTWNKNTGQSTRDDDQRPFGERVFDPSPFARTFTPWLHLLGVEQPERVLRRAYEHERRCGCDGGVVHCDRWWSARD